MSDAPTVDVLAAAKDAGHSAHGGRRRLFTLALAFFGIPPSRVLEIGSQIEL